MSMKQYQKKGCGNNMINYADWESIYNYYYDDAIYHGASEEWAERYAAYQADMQVKIK